MVEKTQLEAYIEEREELNRTLLAKADRVTKRFISLDSFAYKDGALNSHTKELIGLAASTVLRCDDCIKYHLMRCGELDVPENQIIETMGIAMLVGGSITIPHVRRAAAFLESMKKDKD